MDTITLKANIEGLGEREITLNVADILAGLKPEHFGVPCLRNHSPEELSSLPGPQCELCEGTGIQPTSATLALKTAMKWQAMRLLNYEYEEIIKNPLQPDGKIPTAADDVRQESP